MTKIKNVGRPAVAQEKKNKPVSFSASPALIKSITEQSELLFGGNRTKYIVHKLTQKSSTTKDSLSTQVDRIELFKLIKEVNKIGTNLNQIARRTNLGFRKDEPLKRSLFDIQNKMDELINLMNTILQNNNPNFK